MAVAFSPDDRYVLTGGDDGVARLWDTATGDELRRFETGGAGVGSVAFDPGGRFVLTGGGSTRADPARLWDAESGELLQVFEPSRSGSLGVNSAAFSPDGQRVVTGDRQGLTVWRVAAGR
jgi:WD40 repeat protein